MKHKYKAIPTTIDGKRYDSKLEAKYAQKLEILKKSGEIIFFLRQVPFDLPGNVKYRVDFVEFWDNGEVIFTDCKGMDTPVSTLKIKQVEDLYPIKINIFRKP